MKIYVPVEQAQLLLAIIRSTGEKATLLSVAHDRNEAVIVTMNIPAQVRESVRKLATTTIEE